MVKNILSQNLKGISQQLINSARDNNISAFGLSFYNRLIISALAYQKNGGRMAYVFADYVAAKKALIELSAMIKVSYLPPRNDALVYNKKQAGETDRQRLKTLGEIITEDNFFIVTTVEALSNLYPDKEEYSSGIFHLSRGKEYDISAILARLVAGGYSRVAQVEEVGQFSVRGDILDVYPVNKESSIRCEFFGDTLEELKWFSLDSQLSLGSLDSVSIFPCTDVFYDEERVEKVTKELGKAGLNAAKREEIASDIILRLNGGDKNLSLGYILPLLKHTDFNEFVCPTSVIFDDAKNIVDTFNVGQAELDNRLKTLLGRGEAFGFLQNSFNVNALNISAPKLAFHRITSQNRIFNPDKIFNFSCLELPSYTKRLFDLVKDIDNWSSSGNKVLVFCKNKENRLKVSELLSENRVAFFLSEGDLFSGGERNVILLEDYLPYGCVFFDEKLVIIGTDNIFYSEKKVSLKRDKNRVFSEVTVGDYAVHRLHGIGFLEKIVRLEVGGAARDYYLVNYDGGDKLYVPIENSDSLSRYVGDKPKLSKVGGQDFLKQKEKAKASAKKMAFDLMQLYAKRNSVTGYRYSTDDTFLQEFAETFPFDETEDQLAAIADGLADLKSGKIMDRLLCGDVGYGKTEVALRLAFKVIAEGKQVAFISPTTILAKQHYNTVVSRMESFGVRIVSLTRFDDAKKVAKALELLSCGQADIVCGTHRVLSKDVIFKDLGLLILDEEQRFGVNDKEKIKNIKNNVNVLSLSATPIPRTLHMSMIGIRDISVLDTPPINRIPVQTFVTEYSEGLMIDAVTREVNRGGQVFIVFNRVAEIDSFACRIKELLGEVRVSVAHGQMDKTRLENVIDGFVNGDADVLVASTIIENGIDIVRANTMIVVDADKMGLSQLYQLKGRVGRSDRLAYVFFTFDGRKVLSESGYQRLEAISEFTELGSGFKIAMKDLEIRGAGTILGAEQHGHIEKIGYELYCRILENAVSELSGAAAEKTEDAEVKVLTDFNAFIPDDYIPSKEWKMKLYGSISRLSSFAELDKLKGELSDVYGSVPDATLNLLTIAVLKNIAATIGASAVTVKKTGCSIKIDKLSSLKKEVVLSLKEFNGDLNPQKSLIDFGMGNKARINMIKFLANLHKIKA